MAVFVVDHSVRQPGVGLSGVPPVTPSLILARLRQETRAEHEAVEQVLDLMSTSLTREGYRQRLEQFHGFYAPIEEALQTRGDRADSAGSAALSPATRSALASRLVKAAQLRQDLQSLGVAAADLPRCRDLPPLETQADILGCLYVMEGATLGGRLITSHVQATLGITPAAGGGFFEGYGNDTGKMWQLMRHLLVGAALDTPTENAMVASAIATFAGLRRWCQSGHKSPNAETTRHA